MRALRERCANDNHGRMVVRVRYCPGCGEFLNPNIAQRMCPDEAHAKLRRARNAYCMDCGAALGQGPSLPTRPRTPPKPRW